MVFAGELILNPLMIFFWKPKQLSCKTAQMADCFSKSKRSEIMGRVSGKNTKPELIVRSFLHRHGYRFRLHRKDLPGSDGRFYVPTHQYLYH